MTAEEYRAAFGREPMGGELECVNCRRAGEFGHWFCGVCRTHKRPRFRCGCAVRRAEAGELVPLEGEKIGPWDDG